MAKRKNIADSDDSYGTDNATETENDHGRSSSGQFGASSTPGKAGAMSSTYTDNKDSDSDSDSDISESETLGDSSMKKKLWDNLKKKYLAAQLAEEAENLNDREDDSEISESR